MTDKPKCVANVYFPGQFRPSRCSRAGVVQEDCKWWCKQHSPATQAARRKAADERYEAKYKAMTAKWAMTKAREKITAVAVALFKQEATMDDLERAVAEYERLAADV